VSPYLENHTPSGVDHLPRTICGGLALPPRQLPPPATPIVAFAPAPDALTTILAGIRNTAASAFDEIRRAAASRGIS